MTDSLRSGMGSGALISNCRDIAQPQKTHGLVQRGHYLKQKRRNLSDKVATE
jgi:hypothetical protein